MIDVHDKRINKIVDLSAPLLLRTTPEGPRSSRTLAHSDLHRRIALKLADRAMDHQW